MKDSIYGPMDGWGANSSSNYDELHNYARVSRRILVRVGIGLGKVRGRVCYKGGGRGIVKNRRDGLAKTQVFTGYLISACTVFSSRVRAAQITLTTASAETLTGRPPTHTAPSPGPPQTAYTTPGTEAN